MAASQAEAALHAFGHKPVAGVLLRVHAQRPPRAAACCAQPGAFFFQSSQSLSFRDIAQSLAALPADTVLEVENVAASLAGKEFHVGRAILRRYRPAGALAGLTLTGKPPNRRGWLVSGLFAVFVHGLGHIEVMLQGR